MIHINLMPKPKGKKTLKRLETAYIASMKLLILHLEKENKLQEELIKSLKGYIRFIGGNDL
jgi:hypothetical protein